MSDTEITEGEPTLEEMLLLYAKRAGAESGYGDLPAKVIGYNAAQQTATVSPLVLVPKGGRLQAVPPVVDVQVRWPAGSTWSIVGELVAGDFGWLRFAGADISAWKMQGTESDPTARQRRSALSDCVFEPGSQPVSVPLAADAYAAGALVIKAASLLLGDSSATIFVALSDLVEAVFATVENNFNKHGHAETGATTSTPVWQSTGVPMTADFSASVAATKVKAI